VSAPDYPLLLRPHLMERVWGGARLGPGIGEAWDLSVHPEGLCHIANGPLEGRTLAEVATEHESAFGGPLTLLAKRLDCAETLSVQVHPKNRNAKTESWVVLDAKEGAGVYHGFSRPVTRNDVERAARDATLPELLRFLAVEPGDAIFVPAGTVHAIGTGVVLFELQQSSDTTYRLHDWGRNRPLHIEEALACAALEPTEPRPAARRLDNGRTRILECEHFYVDRLDEGDIELDPGDSWCALFGPATLGELSTGEEQTVLVPRAAGRRRATVGRPGCLLYGPA